jgi:hypothetical protein
MKAIFTIFILAVALAAAGQTVSTVGTEDIEGLAITRSDTYSGQSLYGYLNGGADLYLEYGFVKLYVKEYTWQGEPLKAEVWVMNDAPSAFGIYMLSHSTCSQWNMLSTFSCTSRYQATAASGPLFISVTNTSGTPTAEGYCAVLAKITIDKNPQDPWYMPGLFQSEKLGDFKNTIRYFEGPLGIQNGIPVMSDLLEGMKFQMFTIMTADPGTASMIARIVFDEQSSVKTFLARAQLSPMDFSSDPVQVSNNMYRSWYKVNDTKIIYMESPTNTVNLKDYIPKTPPPYWLEN